MNKLLEKMILAIAGALANKMGRGWKTITGSILLTAVIAARVWASRQGYGPSMLSSIENWLEMATYLAGTVFGVGIINKAVNMAPPKKATKRKPK